MKKLTDKVVLIADAARGMGLATAQILVKEKIIIIAADRDIALLREKASSIDGEMICLEMESGSEEGLAAVINKSIEMFGRVDVLIRNSGVYTYREAGGGDGQGKMIKAGTNLAGEWVAEKSISFGMPFNIDTSPAASASLELVTGGIAPWKSREDGSNRSHGKYAG